MKLIIIGPNYNQTVFDVTKIKTKLRTGVIEIYNMHQDLIGKIDNDIIEIETPLINSSILTQDAIFFVENQTYDSIKTTLVFVFAKEIMQITQDLSSESFSIECELKKSILKLAKIPTQLYQLNKEIEFLEKLIEALKAKNQ